MTKLQSGNVEIEFLEPYACEGCGAKNVDLIEDDGMNWLCKKCAELDQESDPSSHPAQPEE